jgi:hypothetical protein
MHDHPHLANLRLARLHGLLDVIGAFSHLSRRLQTANSCALSVRSDTEGQCLLQSRKKPPCRCFNALQATCSKTSGLRTCLPVSALPSRSECRVVFLLLMAMPLQSNCSVWHKQSRWRTALAASCADSASFPSWSAAPPVSPPAAVSFGSVRPVMLPAAGFLQVRE